MRRVIRALAVGVATMVLAVPAVPAAAVPLPDTSADGEWWFVAWDVPKIWNLGAQGQGITVAVLDTGVNPAVAGLSSVLGPGIDITTGSGNGRTDRDESHVGHGTLVTAFIAGQGGLGDEVGVAPRARILPVIVSTGEGDAATLYAAGIRWAADHGAKVVNLSQAAPGFECPAGVQAAVKYAVDKGAVVVAGAGNDGDGANLPQYPANCHGVLAVGAVDIARRSWPKSQRQSYVDVAAPGVHMRAVNANGDHGVSNGTSDATALVSGAIALVWSKYPRLTNRQGGARILATLKDDADQAGHDDAVGGGIVRPYNAITRAIPANAPNPVFDELAGLPSQGGTPSTSRPAPTGTACTAGPAACAPRAGSGGGSSTPLLLGVLAVVLAAGGGAVAWVLLAARRRRLAATASSQSWPIQPPGWPTQPGPPPPQHRDWPPRT